MGSVCLLSDGARPSVSCVTHYPFHSHSPRWCYPRDQLAATTPRHAGRQHTGARIRSRRSTGAYLSIPYQPARGTRLICTGQPVLGTDPRLNSRCPHTHDSSSQRHARCSHGAVDPGPTHIHRAGTRPRARPAIPHLHPSCATAPHCTTAPFGTSAAHLSTSLCTAHLSARHSPAPSHAPLRTATSRCTSLYALCSSVQSAGSTLSPNRQVTSFGMECLPERVFSVPLRRQGAAAAQQGGGQACQLDRTT